jgi:hypothetical protein
MALLFSDFVFKDNLVLEITKLWVLRVPSIQIPTQDGKIKILLSEFRPWTNPGTKNNTQNFEIKASKGTPLVNFFREFVIERIPWPKNGFIVFRRYDLVEKSIVRFILGWYFLNKTSNPNFALGLYGK